MPPAIAMLSVDQFELGLGYYVLLACSKALHAIACHELASFTW